MKKRYTFVKNSDPCGCYQSADGVFRCNRHRALEHSKLIVLTAAAEKALAAHIYNGRVGTDDEIAAGNALRGALRQVKEAKTDAEALKLDPCADGCRRGCAHDRATKDYTKAAHTPGRWEMFEYLSPAETYGVRVGGMTIAHTSSKPDASLIASAPGLLTALKMAEDAMEAALFSVNAAVNSKAVTFDPCDNPVTNLKHQIGQVRAAIAAAEGR